MNQSPYNPFNYDIGNNQQEERKSLFTLNIGKKVSIYVSYPDSVEWRDKIFTGVILKDEGDHILIRQEDGNDLIIWSIYINYAIFDGTASY